MNNTPAIEVKGLSMRFGGVTAIERVDFKVGRGDLRCLIGPNGAGKSTFFKCLTGQLVPSGGQVWINGECISGNGIQLCTHEVARKRVGIKTQIPSLMNGLTVEENLWLAANAPGSALARADLADAVDDVLASLELQAVRKCQTGLLAHGQRQLVELGVVLCARPSVLLLDEPAGGLTQAEVERMAMLILKLAAQSTIVVVEHDMAFVQMIARSVTVFHNGAVLAEGDAQTVLGDQRVRSVYLGKQTK